MLLHADNFNYYGTDESNMLDGVYAQIGSSIILDTDPDGISPEKCLSAGTSSSTMVLRYVLPSAVATIGFAFRIWLPSLPSNTGSGGSTAMFDVRDGSNNILGMLWVTTTGAIKYVSGSAPSSTLVAETTGPVITAGGWYHIEGKILKSATVGTVEVRVEGITVIDADTLNTGATTIAQVGIGTWNSGNGTSFGGFAYYKDFVVWDTSGTENNDFLGAVIVYELKPTADVSLNWTSTDANGFSVLDNNPPDDALHYISASDAPPAAAVFELTDLPADVSSVKGIITRVRAAKIDGGDGQLQVSLRSGVSDDAGADRPITVAQTYWSDVSELDPDTGAAWLPGAVDDARLVINRTV